MLYINDIDGHVVSKLSKFADDTKLFKAITSVHDDDVLKNDLENLCKWLQDWLMLFNYEKCKVGLMHFGHKNTSPVYSMGGHVLEVCNSETDLGVIGQDDLKVSEQCAKAIKIANRIFRHD